MFKKIYACLLLVCFLFLNNTIACFSKEYFVSPQGDDKNEGTKESPWKTPEYAGKMGKAGDTIFFLPGDYTGKLQLVNSGTPEAPIIFCSTVPRQARLIKSPGGKTITITGASFIQIKDMRVESAVPGWTDIRKSNNITIENCEFTGGGYSGSFRINEGNQIKLLDNDFVGGERGSDLCHLHSSTQVLIEGNAFSRGLHTLLAIHLPEGPKGNNRIVVRGNVFHAGWCRNFENFGHPQVLIEDNIFTNAFTGGRSGDGEMKLLGDKNVFRFNRVFKNYGGNIIAIFPHREWHYTRNTRIYNNVFHSNLGWIGVGSISEKISDLIFKNNVFYENNPYGSQTHLHLTGGTSERVQVINNVFSGVNPNTAILWGRTGHPQDAEVMSLLEARKDKWLEVHGEVFKDNIEKLPLFASTENFNYTLSSKSPLIDVGAPLTNTSSAGKGNLLPVEDPYYFYDGYGIEGERGDLIAVGSSRKQARVTRVDYEKKVLHLDKSIQWKKGEPVSLAWVGKHLDIGAFEYGKNPRASVQIIPNKGVVKPGEPVEFKSVINGMVPPFQYRWILGDSTQSTSATLTHKFSEEKDYGVRLRVTDSMGSSCVGVGYIDVKSPPKDEDTLIKTTFDTDDKDWWIYWRFYRPMPTKYEHLLNKETGKGIMHIFAPRDGSMLSANIAPREWDINKYPTVRIKYKIKPGTVISIVASGFTSGQRNEEHLKKGLDTYSRSLFLARVAPKVPDRKKARPLVSVREEFEKELIADGEWHEIELDVRLIQKEYPEVNTLQSLSFSGGREGGRGTGVLEGDEYWLDEIYIGK